MKNKKIFLSLPALICALSLFISCGNKIPEPDQYGFYHELSDGVKAAKKAKKNILLYVTMAGFDSESETFVNNVLRSPDYKSAFSEKYVTVLFDFGSEAYINSEASHFTTDEEKKAAEALSAQIIRNVELARTLDLTYTPCVFLMNEDGYGFGDELYSEDFETAESLYNLISGYEDDFTVMQEMVNATKKGSAVDRVEAVNIIYQIIEDKYMPTMAELFKSVPEMDKKNESGLVSYLYFVYVMEESRKYTSAGDYFSAISVLRDAASSNNLEGEEKQQAYYMAAELLIQTGASDSITILGFLNNAIQAAPETELAQMCQKIMSEAADIIESNGASESGSKAEAE